jgi:hypothetical protein
LPARHDRTIIARMDRPSRLAGAVGAAAVAAALTWFAPPAHAAPAFVYRSLVPPRHDVALDLGLGYGHEPTGPDTSHGGFGLNFELAGSVSYDLELGIRTGVRLDGDARVIQADRYARTFDTETFGTGTDTMANPELHLRWLVARGAVAQLGLEGRAYLPIERGTYFGVMFGMPLWLRLASVRFDTGLYVPIIFADPGTRNAISIPLHIWIQASSTFWLGPLLGLRIVNNNPGSYTEYPFGFGLGSMLAHNVDLKAWFLFPDMGRDQAARWFGAGVGLQIRFE